MRGYIPSSDDFMSHDPECVDEYHEWQLFAKFLIKDEKIQQEKNNSISTTKGLIRTSENRRRLKRYRTRLTLPI